MFQGARGEYGAGRVKRRRARADDMAFERSSRSNRAATLRAALSRLRRRNRRAARGDRGALRRARFDEHDYSRFRSKSGIEGEVAVRGARLQPALQVLLRLDRRLHATARFCRWRPTGRSTGCRAFGNRHQLRSTSSATTADELEVVRELVTTTASSKAQQALPVTIDERDRVDRRADQF